MFEFLRLAHPPLGPQPIRAARLSMRVPLTDRIGLPLPILAYDLPWSEVVSERAAMVADALDELGIAVAALRCELGNHSTEPAAGASPQSSAYTLSNRFCPYRPERYGLRVEDLTTAKIIDVRLVAGRDSEGRFDYSPAQMRRWDLRAGRRPDTADAFDAPMPAMLWPPDVRALDRLPDKIAELRQLAPTAAISISLGTDALESGLPRVLQSGAEILAIRADDWPQADTAQLAARIAHTRQWLDANEGKKVRMIVVPPPSAGAMDCVKVLALGADMVAVDGWCDAIMQQHPKVVTEDWAAATLGVSTRPAPAPVPDVDTAVLRSHIDRMAALIESTGVAHVSELGPQHLVSTGPTIPGVREG